MKSKISVFITLTIFAHLDGMQKDILLSEAIKNRQWDRVNQILQDPQKKCTKKELNLACAYANPKIICKILERLQSTPNNLSIIIANGSPQTALRMLNEGIAPYALHLSQAIDRQDSEMFKVIFDKMPGQPTRDQIQNAINKKNPKIVKMISTRIKPKIG